MSKQKSCEKYKDTICKCKNDECLVKFERKSIAGLDVTKVYSHNIAGYELPNYKINKDS